mmetsp:Transcript_34082/g.49913  ORF Transcript_34082/g.49913 Transcript_34082/m.49913 type:complete len:97 (+) Transcript_34082:75-365(+)
MKTMTVLQIIASFDCVLEWIKKLTMDAHVSLRMTVILVGVTGSSASLRCLMEQFATKTLTVSRVNVALVVCLHFMVGEVPEHHSCITSIDSLSNKV